MSDDAGEDARRAPDRATRPRDARAEGSRRSRRVPNLQALDPESRVVNVDELLDELRHRHRHRRLVQKLVLLGLALAVDDHHGDRPATEGGGARANESERFARIGSSVDLISQSQRRENSREKPRALRRSEKRLDFRIVFRYLSRAGAAPPRTPPALLARRPLGRAAGHAPRASSRAGSTTPPAPPAAPDTRWRRLGR